MSPACALYGERFASCYGGNASDYESACQSVLDYYGESGAACVAAFEDYYVCIGGLECEELPMGCPEELDAAQTVCV